MHANTNARKHEFVTHLASQMLDPTVKRLVWEKEKKLLPFNALASG